MSSKGNGKDLHCRYKLVKPKIKTKKEYEKKILGYIGMQIGLLEVLQRREYLDPDKDMPNETKAWRIGKDIHNFKYEVSEVEFCMEKLDAGIVLYQKDTLKLLGVVLNMLGVLQRYCLENKMLLWVMILKLILWKKELKNYIRIYL